jgi:phosphopantothenoylcysteine decarboxylase/phosphopantothenate--cysteine ligase
MLRGRKILIGITGSIAAYKIASLVRLLVKDGAEVRTIMTSAAMDFITPLTLATLSGNPVLSDMYQKKTGAWESHVELGLWADIFVVAPASANTIAKMAHGLCDNLLTAVYLSARCPVVVAPAMDLDMYRHSTTTGNLEILRRHNVHIIEAAYGPLASGLTGEGRMEEPEAIFNHIVRFVSEGLPLKGKRALVTAGPTHEAIDPVRFIGNHSTGKMGYAIARVLAEQGAEVVLVSGPTALEIPHPAVKMLSVQSAQQMYEACAPRFETSDVVVLAAAVADFKPIEVADRKIKKTGSGMDLQLQRTVDIAGALAAVRKKDQVVVGFALETDNELENARKKLEDKNFDMIVLNSLRDAGAGFGHDTNRVTLMMRDGTHQQYDLKHKSAVAADIVEKIVGLADGLQ